MGVRISEGTVVGPVLRLAGRDAAFVRIGHDGGLLRVDPSTAQVLRRVTLASAQDLDVAGLCTQLEVAGSGRDGRVAFERLARLGVFTDGHTSDAPSPDPGRRPWRVHLLDPSRGVARWWPGRTLSAWSAVAIALLVVVGVVLAATERVDASQWSVPVVVAAAFLVLVHGLAHELAHAAALTAAGGRCASVGLTAAPLPGLYADVGDVVLVPDRRDRVVVYLAGPLVTGAFSALYLISGTVALAAGAVLPGAALTGAGWVCVALLVVNLAPWPGSDGSRALAHWRAGVRAARDPADDVRSEA